MKDFRIGDKVILTGGYNGAEGEVVGVELNERCKNRYLVKSGVINKECGWNYEEAKRMFDDKYDIKPYEGYAIWTDDIKKIEEVKEELKECEFEDEENCMELKFSLGQNVMYNGEESKVVGIDKTPITNYHYLVTTNTEKCIGCFYRHKETFKINDCITFLDGVSDDTKCAWVKEKDLEELEPKSAGCDLSEEYIKNEFDKIREQKRQTIKEMSEKVLSLTLEIKEIEAEIEKIKKEWLL